MLRALSPIPVLYGGFPLHPEDDTDPYVFRIDLSAFALGSILVVFSQNARGATTPAYLDVMPLTLNKNRPR